MQAVDYPHLITRTGDPRLARLPRVRVIQIVMDQLAHGWSAEEIKVHYPHLELAEIYAALLYYCDHKEELDREIREEWEQADRDLRLRVPVSQPNRIGGIWKDRVHMTADFDEPVSELESEIYE